MNYKASLLAITTCFFGVIAIGQAAFAAELGEAATNPVSNLIQFRLQDSPQVYGFETKVGVGR
ncbi:MAG: hypothetical protein V7700_14010 [Halioglobus sp.]